MAQSDAELVAAVRGGSREAAGRLAERYLRATRAVALAIVRNVAAAEDVCQDAFVQSIERIADCRDPDRYGAWLLQIVRNRSRNHLRDEPAARALPLDAHPTVSAEPSPHQSAERAEIRERILAALEELSEHRRVILLLHDLEGWTHLEIAERLEMPHGTVRSHLHYARKQLRALLRELEE
ncbi:MAG: sigma-70 family RNA polymerase sigma factor [Gemmatimonadota bacterium]